MEQLNHVPYSVTVTLRTDILKKLLCIVRIMKQLYKGMFYFALN